MALMTARKRQGSIGNVRGTWVGGCRVLRAHG